MEGNMASLLTGRQRLEATLNSPALTTKDNVYRMVCDQLYACSSDNKSISCASDKTTAQWRFTQVWNLLELLRSVSGEENQKWDITTDEATSGQGWKLKHDTGQMRVMYREGPEGSPFHTLLAEGLIYSPLISAFCLAWEAPSYKYWWPQMNVPTFKIMESRWIKRGHSGEDLSFIRVKAPWPLAAREVLMYAFELEYFDEDLIIVLLHSAPDVPAVEEIMDGLNPLDIPDASPDGVQIELAGGFALQRITADQSYFRTVANMDIKLDFVPPSLINFISRQLIGLGFKLYQKTLTSLSKNEASSEHFKKLLETEPMYSRIKAGLQLRDANKMEKKHTVQGTNELDHPGPPKRKAADWESLKASKSSRVESDREIMEETSRKDGKQFVANAKQTSVMEDCCHNCELMESVVGDEPGEYRSSHDTIGLDPEVQRALQTLDKVISFLHARKACSLTSSPLVVSQSQDESSLHRCNTSSVTGDLHQHELSDFVKEQDTHYPDLVPPRPEKITPITHVLHGNEKITPVSNTNSFIVKAKGPKVKHSFLCFKFSFFCCG